jgi:ZIP family zinc transporter
MSGSSTLAAAALSLFSGAGVLHTLLYAAVPVAAMAIGGTVAVFRTPSAKTRSLIQHFAAGLVFAAVAVEVLPDLMHYHAPAWAAAGLTLGAATMLFIRWLTESKDENGRSGVVESSGRPARLAAVVGTDILIDGLLIGVMLAAGQKAGALVTLALAVELASLGLATAPSLGRTRKASLLSLFALALLPAVGALGGHALAGVLVGGWFEAVLAFAAAALLYLATEELLVEAHEVPETPLATALFFAGFLILMIVDMLG